MCCSTKDDRLWLGLVVFVIGASLLLQRFDVIPAETWDYLWPSILLVSGLKWMVGGGSTMPSCEMESSESCDDCGMVDCSCSVVPAVKKAAPKKSSKRK